MNPTMYLFINTGLNMSPGKIAAQAAHAAVEAYQLTENQELIDAWYTGGHYKKLVMEARDSQHLLNIAIYLESRGFRTEPIIDEGLTEVNPHSLTALGVEIVDKDDEHTAATFSTFKLLKPPKQPKKKKRRMPWNSKN